MRAGTRVTSMSLPIDRRAGVEFRAFLSRTPLFTLSTGRVLVTLTLPEHLRPEDVEFARLFARQANAYAIEVERLYRGVRSSKGALA